MSEKPRNINRLIDHQPDTKMKEYFIEDYSKPINGHVYVESWFHTRDGYFFVWNDRMPQMNSDRRIIEHTNTVPDSSPQFLKLYLPRKWR